MSASPCGSLLGPELVTLGLGLIASGPSGTGKTHLAVAIAYRAIQNGFEARFTTATALIDELSTATRKGRLRHLLPTYTGSVGRLRLAHLPTYEIFATDLDGGTSSA